MNRILNLKKGDPCIVAIEEGSNAARYKDMSIENIEKWTYNGEVISLGRKYVTVSFGCHTEKFEIDNDYRQKYVAGGSDYRLYEGLNEVYEDRENEGLWIDVRNFFSSYGKAKLPLEKTKEVLELIKKYR